MKKLNYLILSVILSFTLYCETDNSEFETIQSEDVFVIGEVKKSNIKMSNSGIEFSKGMLLTDCGSNGPRCELPNQTLTFTLITPEVNATGNWTVSGGNIFIIGSGQGTNTVTLFLGSDYSGDGELSVEINGSICASDSREIPLCGNPITPEECQYSLGILDEYIDGTQSGANVVYLHAGGNFPTGTTYEWKIRRQNGTIQFYSPSTSNPRLVSASINNRITRATVTAKFEDCEKTVTKTFMCAIPNADINGDLFPECGGNGNGGFGFN